jgi:predicted nucleic acid-binding protein
VKLVLKEHPSEKAHARLLKYFNPAGSFFITSFCLFEALSVLKRKMLKRQIERAHYFKSCYFSLAYKQQHRLRIEDPDLSSFKQFRLAKQFAERHSLDLSDALQIVSLKHGWLSHFVMESTPVLITVDGHLESAAQSEGLLVWNCENAEAPPER